jgi:hypothetical protein
VKRSALQRYRMAVRDGADPNPFDTEMAHKHDNKVVLRTPSTVFGGQFRDQHPDMPWSEGGSHRVDNHSVSSREPQDEHSNLKSRKKAFPLWQPNQPSEDLLPITTINAMRDAGKIRHLLQRGGLTDRTLPPVHTKGLYRRGASGRPVR